MTPLAQAATEVAPSSPLAHPVWIHHPDLPPATGPARAAAGLRSDAGPEQ